jgi:outer membrane protein assembly factor BamB
MPLDTELRQLVPELPDLSDGGVSDLPSLYYDDFEFDPVDDLIDRGRFLDIHRATVPAHDVVVALKQVTVERTTKGFAQERLTREAELASAIDPHPYIATVYDWGEDPWAWLATEYLDGGKLSDRLQEMCLDQRLWTAYAITDAVTHVHLQAAEHHDISLSNILFASTPEGLWDIPKLIDWSEARTIIEDEDHDFAPTPAYAPPELLSEGSQSGDVRSDLYQLGVVCYRIITGEHPNHRNGDPRPLSDHVPVTGEMDDLLLRAMETDPDDRFEHTYPFRERMADLTQSSLASRRTMSSGNRGGFSSSARRSTDVDENTEQIGGTTHRRPTADTRSSTIMYRGGRQRRGTQPDEQPVQGPVNRIWSADTGRVVGAPAIVDDMLLFGANDKRVHALRTDTGGEKWSMKADDKFESSPAVACGRLFIGNHDNKVYALDRTNGDVDWTHQTNFWVTSSPAVHDGIVYIGSSDYSVYALEADTGDILWEFPTEGDIGWSSPAVVENLVVVASGDGNLYGVNLNTGAEEWRFVTDFLMHTTPAVANGIAYVGSSQNRLYAIEIDSGELEWTFDTGDDVQSAPAVSDRTVFFGSDDGAVYAVNTTDGTEQWSYPTNRGIAGGVTVVGDTVYAGNDAGTIFALDTESGRPRWRQNLRSAVTAAPVVSDSRLFVGTDDGMVAIGPSQQ